MRISQTDSRQQFIVKKSMQGAPRTALESYQSIILSVAMCDGWRATVSNKIPAYIILLHNIVDAHS